MLNLKQLPDELKFGKVVKASDKGTELITPVFRASFPRIVEPEGFRDGSPRFTLAAIFNAKDPSADAHVDITKVMLPAFAAVAAANNLLWEKVNPIKMGIRYRESDNTPIDGYTESSAWCTMSKYPSAQRPQVPCFSPTGRGDFDPAKILGGYYVRAKVNPYKPKKWNTLALGLVSVQLIAVGPEFASAADPTLDGIEGAEEITETFENAASGELDFSQFS